MTRDYSMNLLFRRKGAIMTAKHAVGAPSSRRGKPVRTESAAAGRTPATRKRRRARPNSDGNGSATISPEERLQLVTLGAYYRAEARGFAPGREMQDWLEAECEVDASLQGRPGSPDSV